MCATGVGDKELQARCGDKESSKVVVRAWCQGLPSCQLPVNVETFGDPCPRISKFLEVQFRCLKQPQHSKFPQFGEKQISKIWNNKNVQEETLNKSSKTAKMEIRKPERVPVTEASITRIVKPYKVLQEMRPRKEKKIGKKTALSNSDEDEGRKKTVLMSSMACLVMLPLLVFMTLLLLFGTFKKEEEKKCETEKKEDKSHLLNSFFQSKEPQKKKKLSKYFCSEPIIFTSDNLVGEYLPPSRSILLLDHNIRVH